MWIRLTAVGVVGIGVGVLLAWSVLDREAPPSLDTREVPDEPVTVAAPAPAPLPSLAQIAAIANDFDRNTALYAHLAHADLDRVHELLALTDALPSTPHRYDIKHVIYVRFAAIDPQSAVDHMLDGAYRTSWLAAVFRAWAHADLDAAVSRAERLDADAKAIATRTILELELPDGKRVAIARQLDAEHVVAAMETRESLARGETDFPSVWQEALGEVDTRLRLQRLTQIATEWATRDPAAAIDAASATEGQIRMAMQMAVIRIWTAQDPIGVVAWLSRQEPSSSLQSMTSTMMVTLARNSMADAISSLDAMPDHVREYAEQGLVRTLASSNVDVSDADIDMVLDWYSTAEFNRDHVMMLALSLARRDPERALSWARSLAGEARETAIGSVMSTVGRTDPESARRIVMGMDDADRLEAAKSLLYSQARHDPRAALDWARSFESEAERAELVQQVFRSWARDKPEEAIGELMDLRAGSVRDELAKSVAGSLLIDRPDLVERLFETIDSREARRTVAGMLMASFTRSGDAEKAEFYREALEAASR